MSCNDREDMAPIPPPRNQFEVSEQEDRDRNVPDAYREFQERLARSVDNRARVQHMLADEASRGGDSLPTPTAAQAREYGPLLAAALRRLIAEVEDANRNSGRTDTQCVRVALMVATTALRDAAKPREEPTDAVA